VHTHQFEISFVFILFVCNHLLGLFVRSARMTLSFFVSLKYYQTLSVVFREIEEYVSGEQRIVGFPTVHIRWPYGYLLVPPLDGFLKVEALNLFVNSRRLGGENCTKVILKQHNLMSVQVGLFLNDGSLDREGTTLSIVPRACIYVVLVAYI
jgi:hypothetical protein